MCPYLVESLMTSNFCFSSVQITDRGSWVRLLGYLLSSLIGGSVRFIKYILSLWQSIDAFLLHNHCLDNGIGQILRSNLELTDSGQGWWNQLVSPLMAQKNAATVESFPAVVAGVRPFPCMDSLVCGQIVL